MPATRILVPQSAHKGDVIEIKTLINHVMETGFRRDNNGRAIPRNIITHFTCTYAGEQVFRMDLFTGVAANPFVAFTTVATVSGDLVFEWADPSGVIAREQRQITVT
jgi:sulfur-oxidizing protein SoxZ